MSTFNPALAPTNLEEPSWAVDLWEVAASLKEPATLGYGALMPRETASDVHWHVAQLPRIWAPPELRGITVDSVLEAAGVPQGVRVSGAAVDILRDKSRGARIISEMAADFCWSAASEPGLITQYRSDDGSVAQTWEPDSPSIIANEIESAEELEPRPALDKLITCLTVCEGHARAMGVNQI